MTYRHILFIFALLLWTIPKNICADDNYPYHKITELNDWETGFYGQLLDSGDLTLQIYGIYFLVIESDSPSIESEKYEVIIDDALTNGLTDLQSLTLLKDICTNYNHIVSCNNNLIQDLLIEHHSNELSVYLNLLDSAMAAENNDELIHIINYMSDTSYVKNHLHLNQNFAKALDQYSVSTPLPKNYIELESNKYIQWKFGDIAVDETLLQATRNTFRENSVVMILWSQNSVLPFPAYGNLFKACKDNPEVHDECLIIAQILQKTDFSYIGIMMGLSIEKYIHEQKNDYFNLALVTNIKTSIKHEIECLKEMLPIDLFNGKKHFYRESIETVRKFGERQGYIKHANLLYEHHITNGSNVLENPENCITDNPSTEFKLN